MNPLTLLKNLGINPDEPVLSLTAEEAIDYLQEAIDEYCPDLKLNEMTKEDLVSLLNSYSECVINYHPESCHQERAALLRNFDMLNKYGLTDDDYNSLDFT